MKQAACGGTGCAVLNGETLLRASEWEAVGGSDVGRLSVPWTHGWGPHPEGGKGRVAVGRPS